MSGSFPRYSRKLELEKISITTGDEWWGRSMSLRRCRIGMHGLNSGLGHGPPLIVSYWWQHEALNLDVPWRLGFWLRYVVRKLVLFKDLRMWRLLSFCHGVFTMNDISLKFLASSSERGDPVWNCHRKQRQRLLFYAGNEGITTQQCCEFLELYCDCLTVIKELSGMLCVDRSHHCYIGQGLYAGGTMCYRLFLWMDHGSAGAIVWFWDSVIPVKPCAWSLLG